MTLRVERVGQGPALVLLHGWAMHSGLFAPLVQALRDAFELHLVDLPGHGHNAGAPGPLTLASAAEAVLAEAPQRALWLGWSLGGLVAMQVAAMQAARVRGLVAVAANPRFVRGDDWPHGMDADVFRGFARELGRDYAATVDRFLMLEAQGSDRVREEIRLLRDQVFARGRPPATALCDGLQILENDDLRSTLPTLAMPSLWIAGRRDRLVPPGAMQAAAALAPGGRFHQIDSGGHAPFLTHAGDVAAAVRTFAVDCPP